MTTRTYVFAGGGTGGHIFPAIAIAEAITERDADARFEFLVSDRAIDTEILSARDRAHTPIPAKPFVVSPIGLVRFAGSWGASVRAARERLRDAKARGPVALLAMGGFVCPPAVQAARAERVPVILINLDAVPGRANRWVAKRAKRTLSTCPVSDFDWHVIGPIVRAEARPSGDAAACRRALGLDPNLKTLFVSGGSQGAGTINELIPALVRADSNAFEGWQILHQAGARRAGAVQSAYAGSRAVAIEFIDRVGDAWGAADLAIARAGAGSVAEAWASRTPTVFFPYPHHTDEHQRANAASLEKAGGALVVTDHADADRNRAAHAEAISELLANGARLDKMRAALAELGPSDGAARAAQAVSEFS